MKKVKYLKLIRLYGTTLGQRDLRPQAEWITGNADTCVTFKLEQYK